MADAAAVAVAAAATAAGADGLLQVAAAIIAMRDVAAAADHAMNSRDGRSLKSPHRKRQ
jgi:hypothetical protein